MFKSCGFTYYEIGDSVKQDAYPGCPAVVVAVNETRHKRTTYRIQIDATGHPEAIDENGNPEPIKFCLRHADQLDALNA